METKQKALRYYKKGLQMAEIAKRLHIPAGTVRSWKKREGWTREPLPPEPKRKRGGQNGNQNAKGGRGNPNPGRNAIKHGIYADPMKTGIFPDELPIIGYAGTDPAQLYEDEITLCIIRQLRLLKVMSKYQPEPDALILQHVTIDAEQRSLEEEEAAAYSERIRERIEQGQRLPGQRIWITAEYENAANIYLRLNRELTQVQRLQLELINRLTIYRAEEARQRPEGQLLARLWKDAILKAAAAE